MLDVWKFLSVVAKHWGAWITGGIVMAVLTVYEHVNESQVSAGPFLYGSIIFLLIAFFLAWRDEHRALLEARAAQGATKPIVTAWIDGYISHPRPDDPNSSGVLLTVNVRNTGSPTALEGWQVNVKWPDGTLVEGRRQFIPERLTMEGPGGTGVYYGRDAIYNKTIEKPVERGGLVRGILWVTLPNVSVHSLGQPGASIELIVHDIFHTEYKANMTITSISGPLLYYPGLTPPEAMTPPTSGTTTYPKQ